MAVESHLSGVVALDVVAGGHACVTLVDDDCSLPVVLVFFLLCGIGVVATGRAASAGISVLRTMCSEVLNDCRRKSAVPALSTQIPTPLLTPKEAPNEISEFDIPTPSLFYGSDLSGPDARNLIVGLCRFYNCEDDFIKVLLTLLGGVILPSRNTLLEGQGLPRVSINVGAKEFFVDCEGQIHLKKKKCLRSARAILLENRSVRT